MTIRTLDWRPILDSLKIARERILPGYQLELLEPLDQLLMRRYGLDVSDPQMLHLCFESVGLAGMIQATAAGAITDYDFYQLNLDQCSVMGIGLLQTMYGLQLELEQYLPREVREGKAEFQRLYDPPPDASGFSWAQFTPAPERMAIYQEWRRILKERRTSRIQAEVDQASTFARNFLTDIVGAYVFTVMMYVVTTVATTRLDPEEVPEEGKDRFSAVTITSMIYILPERYRQLILNPQ